MTTPHQVTLSSLAVAAMTAWLWAGCSSQPSGSGTGGSPPPGGQPAQSAPKDAHADHDHASGQAHDDVPITEKDVEMPQDYAALVARVEQLVGDIRDKIAAGTPSKAHRSLDELDIILKKAAEIASKSVPKEHWKEVNVQSKDLAAAHNELHEKIDEKQNPDYAAVAERIQKALEALKAVPAN